MLSRVPHGTWGIVKFGTCVHHGVRKQVSLRSSLCSKLFTLQVKLMNLEIYFRKGTPFRGREQATLAFTPRLWHWTPAGGVLDLEEKFGYIVRGTHERRLLGEYGQIIQSLLCSYKTRLKWARSNLSTTKGMGRQREEPWDR